MPARTHSLRSQSLSGAITRVGRTGLSGFSTVKTSGYGDVAVPDNLESLGHFQGLQRAINSYRDKFGLLSFNRLAVDGELGNLTLAAYKAVAAHSGQQEKGLPQVGTSSELARNALNIASDIATSGGFALNTTPEPRTATKRVQESVGVTSAPGDSPAAPGAPTPWFRKPVGMAGIGLALVLGLAWISKSSKRSASSSM